MSIPQVRVQVAFDSAPTDTVDTWTDVTAWTDLAAGIRFGRGRQDERSRTTGQVCSLTLDNKDGRFTAGSTSSPYSPNLQIGKKLRVSARVGSARGNLLPAEDASFEGGTTGDWINGYFGAPASTTLSVSTTHPSHGSQALLVTFPAAAAGCGATHFTPRLVIGRTYSFRVTIWNAVGNPPIKFGDVFGVMPSVTSTVTGAFQTLSFTWTATQPQPIFGLLSTGATTAGMQLWVDSVQVDEGDANLGTFTTSPPPISDRFTGYVLGWPTSFPGGNVSDVLIAAGDRIAYRDALHELRSVPGEAILATGPEAYYPLTDDEGSLSAGEVSGTGQPGMVPATFGAGAGKLEFGAGTGPATDSAGALMLTPASTSNGKYLGAALSTGIGFFGAALFACVNTSTAATQTIVRLADGGGWRVNLGTDATGNLQAYASDPWGGTHWTLTSPTSIADGGTHTVGVKVHINAGTITVTLWRDGTQVATTSLAGTWIAFGTFLYAGGNPASGDLLTGTLSHVAAWTDGAVDMAAISTAVLTGFEGQSVNAAASQVATWAGIPAADLVAETCSLTDMSHRDTTGRAPAEVLLDLAEDEGGILYVDGSGRYQLHARDHRWERLPVLEIDSRHLATSDIEIAFDTQGLANDATAARPGGGIGQRVINTESRDAIGPLTRSVSVAARQDADLVTRAGWEANSRATPYPRISSLPIDLLTMDDALTLKAAAVDVGDTVTLVTLPAQAVAQAFDLTLEGWSEVLSLTEWSITANTSKSNGRPSSGNALAGQRLLRLDDPTTGLDLGFITGY